MLYMQCKLYKLAAGTELDHFLLLHNGMGDDIASRALALYALYMTYNAIRHGRLGIDDAAGAFHQYRREGAVRDLRQGADGW